MNWLSVSLCHPLGSFPLMFKSGLKVHVAHPSREVSHQSHFSQICFVSVEFCSVSRIKKLFFKLHSSLSDVHVSTSTHTMSFTATVEVDAGH